MKVCIIQPRYSIDLSSADRLFEEKLALLDTADADADIIVLPEYSDVPCAVKTRKELLYLHDKYFDTLMEHCRNTAIRCKAVLFVNALCDTDGEYRNTTFIINRNGDIAGKYYKTHIPPSEKALGIAYGYTYDLLTPYVIELDGIRYGFLTCYDFYFYEAFSAIARHNVDIIIGCSLQRSDSHYTTETICRFLAYNTNAYVVRSSVSFDESSDICGASMIVSPEGRVLANLKSKIGKAVCNIDPKVKFYKPAGYGRAPSAHYEYIEEGRNPRQYRRAGSAVCPDDGRMAYPRVCARGGFSSVAPENSMAAFGAAVACGCQELSCDVRVSEDGVFVLCKDSFILQKNGEKAEIQRLSYKELEKTAVFTENKAFGEITLATLEELFIKLGGFAVFQLNMKFTDDGTDIYHLDNLISLIKKYDLEKYVYLSSANADALNNARMKAPEIKLCLCHKDGEAEETLRYAAARGIHRVQLPASIFNSSVAETAHTLGIKTSVTLDKETTTDADIFNAGADTVVTEDCFNALVELKKRPQKLL